MKELKEFNIDIFRLKNGIHNFEFEINDSFFSFFNFGLIEHGSGKAKLSLKKSEMLMELLFHFKGSVELICDRSLESFEFPVETENKLLIKFGDSTEELSEEIVEIERNTQRLNVAQYIYEFIGLALPMKKVHPRYREEYEKDDSEHILVYSSNEIERDLDDKKSEEIDPRWNVLNKLKNNK